MASFSVVVIICIRFDQKTFFFVQSFSVAEVYQQKSVWTNGEKQNIYIFVKRMRTPIGEWD